MSWYGHGWGRGPRRVEGGIRARSAKGRIGSTWWSGRLLDVLESFGWENRLERGKWYARRGQVMEIHISRGAVNSRVQGSRPSPYDVRIGVDPLTDEEWGAAISEMRGSAVFAAKLLAGQMPEDIEEAFRRAGASLFPGREELHMECSCPDVAVPCKHIAATFYILAEELDRDPFLLFLLRGRSREEVLEALKAGAAAAPSAPPPLPLPPPNTHSAWRHVDQGLDAFWAAGRPLREFSVSVGEPRVNAGIIRRLGEPKFWREPEDFVDLMSSLYAEISRRALDAMASAGGDRRGG